MKNSRLNSQFIFIIAPLLFFLADSAQAQIVPDRTLPNNSEIIQKGNRSTIEGGTTRGDNLFHSFEQFSVPTGGAAHFNNVLTIKNIFSRVTGQSVSNIDGLIRANGTANFFLLNPNGILFGPNASLNIGGSFLATTAERIIFADGTSFSATLPYTSPLLTVTVPIGLGFSDNPGAINVEGTGHGLIDTTSTPFIRQPPPTSLQVRAGQTLALVGGDLALEGGVLIAPEGKIELGSVDNGTVYFERSSSGWNFNYEKISEFKNIELIAKSLVDTSGTSSGSVRLQGANVRLIDGSLILVQNQGSNPSNNLSVNASESIEIKGRAQNRLSRSGLYSETVGGGQGAKITVSAPEIVIEDGSISTTNYGFNTGGNINLFTQNLTLINGGIIGSSTAATGKGGDININASRNVQLIGDNSFFIFGLSAISTNARGNNQGGNIYLSTQDLSIRNNGFIGTITTENRDGNSPAKGGNITLDVSNSVKLIGLTGLNTPSGLISNSFNSADAGLLTLNTSKLEILDGAAIAASAFSSGGAGSILINASDSVKIRNGIVSSSAEIAPESIRQFLGLTEDVSGSSGNIIINTPRLNIADNSLISVRNEGTGDGGILSIDSPSIFLDNASSVNAITVSGRGGNILINSSDLRLDNSSITATAGGAGDGGNININTDTLVGLNNSSITANAFKGRGGNIAIATRGIFFSPDSFITATSELGVDGTVQIEILQPTRQEPIAPKPKISTEQLLATSCFNRTEARGTFNLVGQSGLPLLPASGFDSSGEAVKIPKPSPSVSVRHEDNPVASAKRPWQIGDPIVEPDSVVETPDGQVRFVNASIAQTPVSFEELICEPIPAQSGK